jgi:DNA-binding transcriptional LysR family regulator
MKPPFTNRELFDMRLLASFARVARLGSITKAATELGYAPSAVSQHITAIEHRLGGALLFTRKPGSKLVLTAAGRALTTAADDMLAAAAHFSDVARRISDGEGVVVRVGAYGTALSYLLPEALAAASASAPRALVETVEIEPADGVPLIDTGELDILVAHRYLPEEKLPSGDNTLTATLGAEPMLAVRSVDSALHSIADCVDADWVAGSRRDVDHQLLLRWAGQIGFHPRVGHETRDCHTAAELIVRGMAVGLLPASVVSAPHNRDRLTVLECAPGQAFPSREVLVVTRRGFDTPIGVALLDRMTEVFARFTG